MSTPDGEWNWGNPSRIQRHYLELLEKGTLSDAVVRCGERTWEVHKAILCVRSKWFNTALTGPFEVGTTRLPHQHAKDELASGRQEGRTGIVTITEFEAHEVDSLLHYLYTGNVTLGKHFVAKTRIAASMSMWKMGDFFGLQDLCKISLDGLERDFRRIGWLLSAKKTTADLKQMQFSNMTHLIQALYKEENHEFRQVSKAPFLAFLLSIVRFLAETQEFHGLLCEIPEFASDWAVAVTNTMGSLRIPSISSDKCARCAKLGSANLDTFSWIKDKACRIYCRECFPSRSLEDWTDK